MKQALHIFRKDVRFLWIPIVLVLALTAVFAWSEHRSGILSGNEAADISGDIGGVIYGFFLVLGWLYLIAAAIYKEQPAGDRQFWVTRPYSWKSLVGAKALSIFTFINVPFFVSDIAILHAQGLPSPVRSLMARQAVLTGVFLLPAAALASVTKHYAQIALTGFAGLLLLLFGVGFGTGFDSGAADSWGRLEWIPASILGTLLCLSATSVLLWQYASRRTWIARGILAAAAVLCLWIPAIRPFRLALTLASLNTGPADLQAVHLARPVPDGADLKDWSPLHVEGLPPFMRAQVELMDFTIDQTTTGWSSGWQSYNSGWRKEEYDTDSVTLITGRDAQLLAFRFSPRPVNIKLAVVMTIYQIGAGIPLAPDAGPVEIPGVGDCSITTLNGLGTSSIHCRAAGFPATRVHLNGPTVIGEPRGYGALLDLSPVFRSSINGSLAVNNSFVLTTERPVARIMREITLSHVRLGNRVYQ